MITIRMNIRVACCCCSSSSPSLSSSSFSIICCGRSIKRRNDDVRFSSVYMNFRGLHNITNPSWHTKLPCWNDVYQNSKPNRFTLFLSPFKQPGTCLLWKPPYLTLPCLTLPYTLYLSQPPSFFQLQQPSRQGFIIDACEVEWRWRGGGGRRVLQHHRLITEPFLLWTNHFHIQYITAGLGYYWCEIPRLLTIFGSLSLLRFRKLCIVE